MEALEVFGAAGVPGGLVPQLELVELADQRCTLVQCGLAAQARREQDATGAVQLQIDRMTDQQALQATGFLAQGRQGAQTIFDQALLGERIDAQAGVGHIQGDHQATIR